MSVRSGPEIGLGVGLLLIAGMASSAAGQATAFAPAGVSEPSANLGDRGGPALPPAMFQSDLSTTRPEVSHGPDAPTHEAELPMCVVEPAVVDLPNDSLEHNKMLRAEESLVGEKALLIALIGESEHPAEPSHERFRRAMLSTTPLSRMPEGLDFAARLPR